MVNGLIQNGCANPEQILCCDINEPRLQTLQKRYPGIGTTRSIKDAARARTIVLSVKPNQIDSVCQELAHFVDAQSILVSIAAGVPLERIQAQLPQGSRLVRVMTNTPALVGNAASCFCCNTNTSEADRGAVRTMLESVGIAFEVPEPQLDAVTAIAGSGPAYICMVVESLSDAGVKMGLQRDLARLLAAQTVLGTGKMILETGEHPAVLREKVCSPGGTTIAALSVLEQESLRSSFIRAAQAAWERSIQLGKGDNGQ